MAHLVIITGTAAEKKFSIALCIHLIAAFWAPLKDLEDPWEGLQSVTTHKTGTQMLLFCAQNSTKPAIQADSMDYKEGSCSTTWNKRMLEGLAGGSTDAQCRE